MAKEKAKGLETQVSENDRLLVALCYFFGFIGAIVLLLAKKDKTSKFHAMQNLLLFAVSIVVGTLTFGIGFLLCGLVYLYCAIKVFTERDVHLPFLADYAANFVK